MTTTATECTTRRVTPFPTRPRGSVRLRPSALLWRSCSTGTSDQYSTPAVPARQTGTQWSRPAHNGEAYRVLAVYTPTLRWESAPSTTAGSWSLHPLDRRLQGSRRGARWSCQSGRWHDRGHGTNYRGNVG